VSLETKKQKLPLDKEKIDPNQYIAALLQDGRRAGLLSKQSWESIQAQILALLKDLILRYTKHTSTSVTVETAEKLLHSLYYTLDAGLSTELDPAANIAFLAKTDIRKIYEQGTAVLANTFAETRKQYEDILKNKLEIPLDPYNDTLEKGLPSFFRLYNIVFAAHDTIADIDYPLIFDDQKVRGVFYIKQYLEKLALETEFCRLFSRKDIIRTLHNYGRVYKINYQKTLINIFEIVCNNLLFSVLAGNEGANLTVSGLQNELLTEKLRGLNAADLDILLEETISRIALNLFSGILPNQQAPLLNYLEKYKTILLPRIIRAMEQDSLDYLLICQVEGTLPTERLSFQEGRRLPDERFRLIFDYILSRKKTADKLKIIRSSIPSLRDLRDLLRGGCFFGEEYAALYKNLTEMELGLLGRDLFIEELRSGPLHLAGWLQERKESRGEEIEWEWERQYISFLQNLDKVRIRKIERYVNESQQTEEKE
jgi:hypothetical protein